MKKSDENIAGFFHWTTQPNLLSINYIYSFGLCISVKLKNLKANHNTLVAITCQEEVVYIRKVKKSESKSQHVGHSLEFSARLCISVKLKNLKANHNIVALAHSYSKGCVYP